MNTTLPIEPESHPIKPPTKAPGETQPNLKQFSPRTSAPTIEDLVLHGFALVPIPRGQKAPDKPGWNRSENVVTSTAQLSMCTGNIGLAHAYSTPTPTCAIDVDEFPDAKKWLSRFNINLTELLAADDAVVIWSGKPNSIKLLYRLPYDVGVLASKAIRNEQDKTILEFRCGTVDGLTVQDLIPPSLHPTGTQYCFSGKGDPRTLAMLPKQIIDVWRRQIHGKTSLNSGAGECRRQTPRRDTPRQIALVRHALFSISSDCGYEAWRNIVWSVLSTGWLCAPELAMEWSKTAPQRYEEEAFWAVVNSYDPEREGGITLGTLFHLANIEGSK
jgi:putative DNA primase/helicase